MAIAAMVLGIVALVLSFIPLIAILTFLLGPLAVVLGILALVKRRGRGQAITGIVTGGLGLLIATIGFLIFSALIASGDDDSQQNERDPDVSAQESPASSEDRETDGEAVRLRRYIVRSFPPAITNTVASRI